MDGRNKTASDLCVHRLSKLSVWTLDINRLINLSIILCCHTFNLLPRKTVSFGNIVGDNLEYTRKS